MRRPTIDPSDFAILRELQADLRQGIEAIAHKTGLSTPTVQRRIKRLRENKIVRKEVAHLDATLLGYPLHLVVSVEFVNDNASYINAFIRKANQEEQIQQCYYVTGSADFFLIILARDMDNYEELTQRMFSGDDNIRKFSTSVVMRQSKVSLHVPCSNQ
ncbi:MAG: Lrp/AsnC family transcriptional regulator [Parvibaculaceae bacterium]